MDTKKPVLVVGATGKVGRLVTKQLLNENIPTRIFVRNATKAQELFSEETNLDIVVGDVTDMEAMEKAVEGCVSCISVSGTLRFSHFTDFLPWRLFTFDASKWCSDKSHPYYTNYLAQVNLAILAAKHGLSNGVVRLTGLSTGKPAFNLVTIIFSSILSLTTRYHYAAERDMYKECKAGNIPFVALRPGGLSDEPRDLETTSLQVDPTCSIPAPARVGRSDVAALAIACIQSKMPSRVLAVRWCGKDLKPKAQGTKEDGCMDAKACLAKLENDNDAFPFEYPDKPFGLAVASVMYPLLAFSFKFALGLLKWILAKFV